MGIVIQFPRRSPVHCSEVTEAQAEAAQTALFDTMIACHRCDDTGWIFFRHRVDGAPDTLPCPCGQGEPEYDGAA